MFNVRCEGRFQLSEQCKAHRYYTLCIVIPYDAELELHRFGQWVNSYV